MSIKKIFARSIYDSRGNPTVEVDLWTEKGNFFYLKQLSYKANFKMEFYLKVYFVLVCQVEHLQVSTKH
jgi:hypothetical protein